jgi:hypothetical protein
VKELEELRPHLAAHGCEWLLDAGADLETCRDAIVYLDAKEEGLEVPVPPIEAVVVVDRKEQPRTTPVFLSERPLQISIDLASGAGGYRIHRLNGSETHIFGENVRTNMVVELSVRRGQRAALERLVDTDRPTRPRVNLLPVRRGTPRIGDWIRRLLR